MWVTLLVASGEVLSTEEPCSTDMLEAEGPPLRKSRQNPRWLEFRRESGPPPIASLESPMGNGKLFTPHTSSWEGQGLDGFLAYWKGERENERELSRPLFAVFPGDWSRKLNLGTVPAGSGLFFSPHGQCNNELELGNLCRGSWAGLPGASPVGRLSPGTGREPPEQA